MRKTLVLAPDPAVRRSMALTVDNSESNSSPISSCSTVKIQDGPNDGSRAAHAPGDPDHHTNADFHFISRNLRERAVSWIKLASGCRTTTRSSRRGDALRQVAEFICRTLISSASHRTPT
jgi:hypothetical protein